MTCFPQRIITILLTIYHDNIFSVASLIIVSQGKTSFIYIIFFRMINNKTFSLNRCNANSREMSEISWCSWTVGNDPWTVFKKLAWLIMWRIKLWLTWGKYYSVYLPWHWSIIYFWISTQLHQIFIFSPQAKDL